MSAIGGMRARVALQEEQRAPDGGGGYALAWATVATVWAEVAPLRGRETVQATALSGSGLYRLRLRAGIDVTPALRVLWGSRIFNIRHVRNVDARDRLVEIIAEEGVAA